MMPRKTNSSSLRDHVLLLTILVRDIAPPIWRELRVPVLFSFDRLHRAIQTAFGWTTTHLYQFEVGDHEIGVPGEDYGAPLRDARRTTLRELVKPAVKRFVYRYDFGDDWVHDIAVEARISVPDITEFPVCTGGARSGPPEDCGGPDGYATLLKILRDRTHPEHAEWRRWVGRDFDPETFDKDDVNEALARMRPRRRR